MDFLTQEMQPGQQLHNFQRLEKVLRPNTLVRRSLQGSFLGGNITQWREVSWFPKGSLISSVGRADLTKEGQSVGGP